jgi:hypothetical protein
MTSSHRTVRPSGGISFCAEQKDVKISKFLHKLLAYILIMKSISNFKKLYAVLYIQNYLLFIFLKRN